MSGDLLAVRTDATEQVGAGHAMRCLSAAEAWIASKGRAQCWGTVTLDFVRHRADALGIPIKPGPPGGADILLVDTYDVAEREALASTPLARHRVIVDDMGEVLPTGYDAVWNPNPYGTPAMYPAFHGEVLTGADYVPIRAGLPSWRGGCTGAVSCGGSGVPGELVDVFESVRARLGLKPLLAVGSRVPTGWRPAMATGIWADLRLASWLITTASSTLWEAAAVGIPVVVISLVPNHALAAAWARRHGVPVVDFCAPMTQEGRADILASAIHDARPLPRLKSGAAGLVQRLRDLPAC